MKRESDKIAAKWQWPILILAVLAGGACWLWKWKIENDRNTCILNIRNVQVAVRSWQGMYNIEEGTSLPAFDRPSDLVGPGMFLEQPPVCPSGGVYRWMNPVMSHRAGVVFLECSCKDHQPTSTSGW